MRNWNGETLLYHIEHVCGKQTITSFESVFGMQCCNFGNDWGDDVRKWGGRRR